MSARDASEPATPAQAYVDHDKCAGVAQCVQIAPNAFQLDAELLSVFNPSGTWTPTQLRDARDSCPMEAITLTPVDHDEA